MNISDVERRLEALAAGSSSPDLPPAILDRMARLESGAEPAHSPSRLEVVPMMHRVRSGGGPRSRGLMLLGVAATLALIGGLIYAGGSRPTRKAPVATPSFLALPEPTSLPGPTPAFQALPQPAPPFSLGSWRRVYTFNDGWDFGSIWGGGPNPGVWLSYQDGEIVGIAERYTSLEQQQNCILQSKDGTTWTCSQVPTPTGETCGPGPCPVITGLAVHDGRWVAVGFSNFRSPRDGSPPSPDPANVNGNVFLAWTSPDGKTWTEQPGTRTMRALSGINAIGAPTLPTLVPIKSGFLMSSCYGDQPGLWTSTDGVAWRPATMTAGSQTISCAMLGSATTAGYMASGRCSTGSMAYAQCVAFSRDGSTWTTSDPAAGASPDLAAQLMLSLPYGPVYVAGRWYLPLDTPQAGAGRLSYQASSTDGLHWTVFATNWPDALSTEPGLNEGDYHPPTFTHSPENGFWGINDGPRFYLNSAFPTPGYSLVPALPSTYWSATGNNWQSVGASPPGWAIALAETPTGLVAFMTSRTTHADGSITDTTSVWVADKK
jgi:hypothetical protein